MMPCYENPGFPDTWAGDLALITMAHRGCDSNHCSFSWVARENWAKPFEFWNCPWFGPSRMAILNKRQ